MNEKQTTAPEIEPLERTQMSVAERIARIYFLTGMTDEERDHFWCGHLVFDRTCEFCVVAMVTVYHATGQVDRSIWKDVN